MTPKTLVLKFTDWFDKRPQGEKYLLAILGVGGAIYLYAVMFFNPAQAEIQGLERQLATIDSRIAQQEARAIELRQSGLEDPDSFIRARLEALIEDQNIIQEGIESLAGNLVSPNGMTQMLTSVLDSQEGLTLIKVENRPPEALTDAIASATSVGDGVQGVVQSIGFQVFRHGLILEFQGDYFSTLRYLMFLEAMDESFFWDGFEFEQAVWPEARVRLELHTLSSEEGFIGV
ncbi:MAG: hypothetical protein ACSHXZ_02725 [Gammaproteobacteria bacterium]